MSLKPINQVCLNLLSEEVICDGHMVHLPWPQRWFQIHLLLAWMRAEGSEPPVPVGLRDIQRLPIWDHLLEIREIGKQIRRHVVALEDQGLPLIASPPRSKLKSYFYSPPPESIVFLPNAEAARARLQSAGVFDPPPLAQTGEALHFFALSIFDLEDGKWTDAERHLAAFEEVAPQSQRARSEFLTHLQRARILLRKGDLSRAREQASTALRRGREPADRAFASLVLAFCHLRNAARSPDDLRAARDYAQDAYRMLPPEAPSMIKGHLHNTLGTVARHEGNLEMAEAQYTIAFRYWVESGWAHGLQASCYNLGVVFVLRAERSSGPEREQHLRASREWFLRCVEWARRGGTGRDSNYAELRLADVNRFLGQFDQAELWARAGMKIALSTGSASLVDDANRALVKIQHARAESQ